MAKLLDLTVYGPGHIANDLSVDSSVYAKAFVTSGGTNAQVVRGDGTLANISGLSVSNADTVDNKHASDFATAGHTHSSVLDCRDGVATTFAYSKTGLEYDSYTWLAGWNGYELRAVNKSQFARASHNHNYIISPYRYSDNVMTDDITSDTLFGEDASINKLSVGFMEAQPTWNNYADVLYFTGYCKWGGTQIATEYNAINPRVAIRKFNQSRMNWGDWTEFITSANIGDQTVNSAYSLVNTRNIWGQPFNGTADISTGVPATMPYVLFKNYDNNNYAGYVGRGASSNNHIQIETYSNTHLDLNTNKTTRVRITGEGKVGVGTTSPLTEFTVSGTTYSNQGGSSLPSFMWNKGGTYWGGIGYNGTNNVNEFGPVTSTATWANVDDTDTWKFRGWVIATQGISTDKVFNSSDYKQIWNLGSYTSANSNVKGAIIIELPLTSAQYDMINVEIGVYEYNEYSASTIVVGGHPWQSKWYQTSCAITGNYSRGVKLGLYNGHYCIVLGEENSVWSYPGVWVRTIGTIYDNYSSSYKNRCTVSLVTSTSGVTNPVTLSNNISTSGTIHGTLKVTSDVIIGSTGTPEYTLDTRGTGRVSGKMWVSTTSGGEALNVGGWVGTIGETGWWNVTYGGGIHMEDKHYVRISGSKALYLSSVSDHSVYTEGAFATGKTSGGILTTYYNGWFYKTMYNHGNGNLSIDAPGGSLYLSYWDGDTYFGGGTYCIDRAGYFNGTSLNAKYALDAGDSKQISFYYSTGGFSTNPTWLAAWNGYAITYVSPTVVKVKHASTADLASDSEKFDGLTSVAYMKRYAWWADTVTYNIDNLVGGTTFVYSTHNASTTGTAVDFTCNNNENYRLQIHGSYINNTLYFRNRQGDRGFWHEWNNILDSSNYTTYVDNYYWANVKISTDSSTETYPTFGSIYVKNDSCNNDLDALAYFRHRSNNDWAVIIDKTDSYTWGLDIRCGGEYALKVGSGQSRLIGNTTIGNDSKPRATLDVYGKTAAAIIGKTDGGASKRTLRLGLATASHTGSEYWAFCIDDRNANSYLQIGYTESTTGISLRHDGHLGVGYDKPYQRITIDGNIAFTTAGVIGASYIHDGDNTMYNNIKFNPGSGGIQYTSGIWTSGDHVAHQFITGSAKNSRMVIRNTGYVGINNDSPSYLLDVNGQIHATNSITIDNENWSYFGITRSDLGSSSIGGLDGNGVYFCHTKGSSSSYMYLKAGSGLYIKDNLGVGVLTPSYKLHVDGTSYVTGTTLLGKTAVSNDYRQVYNCGSYVKCSANVTGAIVISLPITSAQHDMVNVEISVYEYNTEAASKIVVGGHPWASTWYNYSCSIIGGYSRGVRLGIYSGKYCIILGTASTVWQYPGVFVTHIGTIYDSYKEAYANKCSVALVTAESSFSSLLTPTNVVNATSVAWSNVTGKPSTYSPSSHNHSSVLDISSSAATTFAYSKSGLGYSDYTWIAAWNGYELRAVDKSQFARASHNHNYIISPYYYNTSVISPDTTSDTIFGSTPASSLMTCGFMSNHSLWGDYADVAMWTGYCKWGGTQLATQYNAISPRVALRKYSQSRSNWGDWVEFITSGNIGSQSVTYATNSTYLYSCDSSYKYGGSNPYYMKMRYNTNGDNRWYLSVYPETPKSVAVDYAYSAGSATYASKVYDSNYTSQPITFSYYSGGFSSNPTWLAAWSGYHITYVSPSNVTVGLSSKVTCTEGSGDTTRPIVVTNQSNQLYYASKCYIHYNNGYIYAAAFFESSDERLKDFENDIIADFNTIRAIPKKYFRWKERPDELQIGTSAQVIQRFYPEIVTSSDSGFLNVDYSKLSIIALSAIDKLHDTDNELKLEIIKLKERINHLENLLNNK